MVDRSARQRTVVAGAATAVCATLLLVLFGSAGAGTLPEAQRGNVKCDDYGVDPIGSIEAPGESVGDVTTALQSDGSFDWSISAGAVSLVLVKGGPVTNVYDYRPGAVSDTGLNAAVNPRSGRHYGYSTIRFCVGSIPPTATPIATSTATPTVTPIATSTVTPTVTSTATPTVTPIATSTVTPTVTPALPTPTTTPTPTVTPALPTPTTTPTPTVTPVPPTPTTTPTPTVTPVPPTPTTTPTPV